VTDLVSANVRAIASELEALLQGPGTSQTERDSWQARASALFQRLDRADAATIDAIPHGVWHYLADADLRVKEQNYLPNQLTVVRDFVARIALTRGEHS
jgi:hypothetical protein